MAAPGRTESLSQLAKQEVENLAQAAVNVVLEPAQPAAARAAAHTSEVEGAAAEMGTPKRGNSQRSSPQHRGSTPGPEPPATVQLSPNELADKLVSEVPEPDSVEEIAEAGPTFHPVVADGAAAQEAVGNSEDDEVEPFSDAPERLPEASEEPPRSFSAVGSPAITAQVASLPQFAAAAAELDAHAPFVDATEAPAEAADEAARSSPVAEPTPSLTAKAAPSMSQPPAPSATTKALVNLGPAGAVDEPARTSPVTGPSASLTAKAAPSMSRSAAPAAPVAPQTVEPTGAVDKPGEPSPVGAPPPALTAHASPSMARSTAPAAPTEPEILEAPEDRETSKQQPVTTNGNADDDEDDDDDDADSDADSPAEPASPAATAAAAVAPASTAGSSANLNLKELPKVAADAALQAGQAYVEAGKQAQLTLKDLLSLRDKEGPPVTLTVDQIATAAFLLLAGVQLLFLPLFMPSTFRLLYSLFWGLVVGLGLSYLFYYNRQRKQEANELLATNLGLKGVQLVAAGIPAVFNVSDEEKMEWLNALIEEVWPFVDKGVCQMIKDITAQMMPGVLAGLPGILEGKVRSVSFKHLTFGAAPFRVETIKVKKDGDNGLVLELSVKWCGDPNITLAIEIPGGQKLCPRVLDISFAAKVRVVLRPLVARLPGFVAAMATVPKPPLIKYRLDFGKALGGSVAPMAVTPVVNYFLRGVLDRMLVWPNRIVVPILQETPQDAAEVQKLMRRIRGMVRVCVVRGKGLRGVEPTEEAIVEMTTDAEYYESTRARAAVSAEELAAVDGKLDRLPNTEIITWEDHIYLLVQEPESQMIRLEAFELPSGRAGKAVAAVSSGRRSVGRALVKLARVCKAAAEGATEPVPMRVQLGEGDWGSPGGPGKGAGQITLAMSYFPCEEFTREQILSADMGIITVRLLAISGLTPSAAGSVTVFASFGLSSNSGGKKDAGKAWKTPKKYWTLAGHVAQLKARIARLEAGRQRDLREGDTAAAEAKAAEMRALLEDMDAADDKSRVTERRVTLDYSMETGALSAFYRVTEKIETRVPVPKPEGAEAGGKNGRHSRTSSLAGLVSGRSEPPPEPEERVVVEDNMVVIKVVQEGRVKRTAETLGVAEVPVSRIRNGYSLNPLSGKKEHGLYISKWRGFDPDNPGSIPPESEWGVQLEGSAGVRVWAVLRWVPCVQPAPHELNEEDEAAFVNALPSMIKPVQSAWQVK